MNRREFRRRCYRSFNRNKALRPAERFNRLYDEFEKDLQSAGAWYALVGFLFGIAISVAVVLSLFSPIQP